MHHDVNDVNPNIPTQEGADLIGEYSQTQTLVQKLGPDEVELTEYVEQGKPWFHDAKFPFMSNVWVSRSGYRVHCTAPTSDKLLLCKSNIILRDGWCTKD